MRPQNALTTAGASALFLAASAFAEVEFERTSIKAPFIEQFQEQIPEGRWTVSQATKQTPVGDETFSYVGTWAVEEPEVFPGIKGDTGLVLKSKAAHHAISTLFPEPIDPKGKPLVVQYEVKLQKGLECGGAYIKLLTAESHGGLKEGEDYTDKTPFTIMFGPDRCGQTNKVHFIFRHKNPLTGEYEEKHLAKAPVPKLSKTTALYTLIVQPTNEYQILINDEVAVTGDLLEDFRPAVNPPKMIDDASDQKPEDWIDEMTIPDEDAVKPEDWDEDAPLMIEDEAATQPKDWLVDEPQFIPDPEAEKPEEWDDEEDGDWIAPSVPNPKCEEVSGCGPWSRPQIKNPAYKGPWERPTKVNPEYKGIWMPRRIANPDFFEDLHPADFEPIGGVGIELWTMTEDILFDNIYIGHDVEQAKKFAQETYHVKKPLEQELEGSTEDDDEDVSDSALNIAEKIRVRLYSFITLFQLDPAGAVKQMPEVPAVLLATVLGFLGLLASLGSLFGAGKSTKTQPVVVKKATVKPAPAPAPASAPVVTEAKIEEIVEDDSGVKKRTTRSSAQ